jgi:hypothetical protein
MYIETKTDTSKHPKRAKKFHHLKCDRCDSLFIKQSGEIDVKRLNNNVKHFCGPCGPTAIGKYARGKYVPPENIGNELVTKHGYIEICVGHNSNYSGVKAGYMRKHIKVMQDHLGRQLVKGEVIHHIDGDKANNDISNLDLCTVAEHNNAHAKIEQIVFALVKQGKVGYDRVTKRYYLV